jgi:hypothetical protein
MNYQLNPSAHPWLHKLACLYRPYETAAHHSLMICSKPINECDLCKQEFAGYLASTGQTAEEFENWYRQVYVPKRKAEELALKAATPAPHSIETCQKALIECDDCINAVRVNLKATGKTAEELFGSRGKIVS